MVPARQYYALRSCFLLTRSSWFSDQWPYETCRFSFRSPWFYYCFPELKIVVWPTPITELNTYNRLVLDSPLVFVSLYSNSLLNRNILSYQNQVINPTYKIADQYLSFGATPEYHKIFQTLNKFCRLKYFCELEFRSCRIILINLVTD